MEAVERADIGHQARTLLFEHLPDRPVRNVGVPVRLGIGNASVLEHSPMSLGPLALIGSSFSSAKDLNFGRGTKNRRRSTPTWFST